MKTKKIIIIAILICSVLLSACFDYEGYPRYKVKEQDDGQYVLTSPDGLKYVTFEEPVWCPNEVIWGEGDYEPIGKSKLGYVFETSSEACVCVNELGLTPSMYFFEEGTQMPELKIENINSAYIIVLNSDREKITMNLEQAEKLAELYSNTESYETKNMQSLKSEFLLVFKCQQLSNHFYSTKIYRYKNGFYMYIPEKDGDNTYTVVNCTTVINEILDNK